MKIILFKYKFLRKNYCFKIKIPKFVFEKNLNQILSQNVRDLTENN